MKKSEKLLVIFLIILGSISMFLAYKSFSNRDIQLDDVSLREDVSIQSSKRFALMIEQDDGSYVASESNTWPTDMVLNESKSGCVDAYGNKLEGSLTFDNETRQATVTTDSTAYCYLYFSYDMEFTFYLGGSTNPGYTSSTDVSAYLAWDDNDITYYCITNVEGYDNCTWTSISGTTVTATHSLTSGEGTKIAYAYIKDADGTVSKKVYDRIIVDTTAPVVNTVTETDYRFDYITLSVNASDTGSGIAKYYYKIGEDNYFESSNKYTFKNLLHGTSYEISVYVEDAAGNMSNVVTNTYSTKASGKGNIVEGGLYRYQGNDVMNYICFGTSDATTCKNSTSKYMYRIIGIDENGQMKLIKNTSIGSYKWHSDDTTNTSWSESDLYKGLNGIDGGYYTDLFVNSSTYTYMEEDSNWYNKIAITSWKYGDDTTVNKTAAALYSVENGWTNTVSAKIGLIYAHDYFYAYQSGGLNCSSSGSYSTCKTAWMYLGSTEWTMSRYGNVGSYYYAWFVFSDGHVDRYSDLAYTVAVRPVFYLLSTVDIIDGTGTSSDPFIIKE